MIVVFLGPTLGRAEARKLLAGDYWPPARQGDVFRAIESAPAAIVLIDGVFESAPSVWHHEFIAAQAAGIPLFGASSMGALRAAELPGVVTPLGEIAKNYSQGVWNDDAAVALLHADESSSFRALTVPWVNVFATVRAARAAKIVTPRQQRDVLAAAESIFYQSRTWRRVLDLLPWPTAAFAHFVSTRAVDLKADDARFALRHVAKLRLPPRAPQPAGLSSFVRRSRLASGSLEGADAGVRTLLLADFARQAGLSPEPARLAHWRATLRVKSADLKESWAEALALEELVLSAPERFVADGPSRVEGAALSKARR